MSENLNRSHPDFSKYDSMSIGELEEILRADAQGPERDDSDVEEILYVMEVLAKKRRQNGIAGKTALEAYQEFQQRYLPVVEEESMPQRKANIVLFRRFAAIAASLVLVFSLSVTANAFSFKDVWNAVVTWAQETFSFSMGVEVSEPKVESELTYETFSDLLCTYGIPNSIVPSYIPNEYILWDVTIDENPVQDIFIAFYRSDTTSLKISVKSYSQKRPEQIEVTDNVVEIYTANGIDYYILQNNKLMQAAWIVDSYECYIAGEISITEMKMMLDSIGKG